MFWLLCLAFMAWNSHFFLIFSPIEQIVHYRGLVSQLKNKLAFGLKFFFGSGFTVFDHYVSSSKTLNLRNLGQKSNKDSYLSFSIVIPLILFTGCSLVFFPLFPISGNLEVQSSIRVKILYICKSLAYFNLPQQKIMVYLSFVSQYKHIKNFFSTCIHYPNKSHYVF